MNASKINSEPLIESFQKLGDAHRSLKKFIKENKTNLSKQTLKVLFDLQQKLEDHQQKVVDFAFDEIFRKKKKRT